MNWGPREVMLCFSSKMFQLQISTFMRSPRLVEPKEPGTPTAYQPKLRTDHLISAV